MDELYTIISEMNVDEKVKEFVTAIKDKVEFVFPVPEEEKKEEKPEEESKDEKPAEESKDATEESKDKPAEEEKAVESEEEKEEPGALPNFGRMLLKSEATVEKTAGLVQDS